MPTDDNGDNSASGEEEGWLQDDDEEEEEGQQGQAKKRVHRPRQSSFYFEHSAAIKRARDRTGFISLALFLLVVGLTSWINIEEGRFPFNVDVLADMAYNRRSWGTPMAALLLVVCAGAAIVLGRIAALGAVEGTVHKVVESDLHARGHLATVQPLPPKKKQQSTPGASAGS
jgi:hypothetical protein